MRRAWAGLALLSASWLFGLRYYHAENWPVWAGLILLGTLLLIHIRPAALSKTDSVLVLVLLLPVMVVTAWPYRAIGLLMFVGVALQAAPIPRRWPRALGSAALAAGVILVVQGPALAAYEGLTARSHELPHALAVVLLGLARLLGLDAALDGPDLALYSVRTVHRLGATWELLLDPATLCFLAGGLVLLWLARRGRAGGPTRGATGLRWWARPIGLLVLVALWLPVRAALLMAIFLHRALRTEYDAPLALMNQFWNPWVHLALLLVPVLLAIRFVTGRLDEPADQPRPIETEPDAARDASEQAGASRVRRPALGRAAALALVFAGAFLLCFGWWWDPAGRRKEGRVLVDEFHSTWEPTGRPFDTEWYGEESGYNYACIYDYCSRFYQMGRLAAPVDDAALQDCDVLVVKVPTARYTPEEVAALERFVTRGGGLLLIGEHTNVFKTGTHLNDIARRFGFRFRYDCLFDIDDVFEQRWRPPAAAHPIVQHLPAFDFAVSCSLDPGASLGRAVIRSTGLRNLPADYHVSNFYPQVEDHAYSRYGAFIQLWATRRGAGRVAAFTDSTVFSNFSTFEPGKAELMLGLLEWLNHRNSPWAPRLWPVIAGALLVFGGLVGTRRVDSSSARRPPAGILLLVLGLSAWAAATVAVQTVHRQSMPRPRPARPFVHVVMDRTLCDTPLSRSGFLAGEANGFGIFERWILRLGWFTSRRRGPEALTGDLVVFAYPSHTVTDEFREAVVRYVTAGGKVLVLDSPENATSSVNSLLYPFGLSLDTSRVLTGALAATGDRPAIPIEAAYRAVGGTPVITLDGAPVAATVRHGRGSVTVVGFASRFADAHMGVTGDVVPDPLLRGVFDLEFTFVRDVLSGH